MAKHHGIGVRYINVSIPIYRDYIHMHTPTQNHAMMAAIVRFLSTLMYGNLK